MKKTVRQKAIESADRCVRPNVKLGKKGIAYGSRFNAYVDGYMAGHAACVRRTSKEILRLRAEIERNKDIEGRER